MKKNLFLALCLITFSPLCLMAETIPANDSRVVFVGRTAVDGTSVSFDWTATYFRIAFSGQSLTMKASETKWDATPEMAATRHNYYNVWIDSPTSAEPHRIIEVAGNDTVIELVDPLYLKKSRRSVHEVIVQKRTEGEQGKTTIHEFTTNGKFFQADPLKSRQLEFIGDSYTCGYGIDAPSRKDRFSPETENIKWLLLIPYVSVIGLALSGVNVIAVLSIGIALNAILGFSLKLFTWSGFLGTIGSGISEMGDLIIVTLLAGGMLELIRTGGGLDYIVRKMTEHIKNKRGAEMSIAALVSLANLCTANNTIAIITVGGIARDISKRFSLDPRKVASILDTFSCLIQGIIPYGAQMLLASGLASISTMSISTYLYYPIVMGFCAIMAILIRKRSK